MPRHANSSTSASSSDESFDGLVTGQQGRSDNSSFTTGGFSDDSLFLYAGNVAAACAAANALSRPQIDLTDQQLKKRRLEMNRNNAQRNRDRKKLVLNILQTEKNELTLKNENLRKDNKMLRDHISLFKTTLEYKEAQSRILKPAASIASEQLNNTQSKNRYFHDGRPNQSCAAFDRALGQDLNVGLLARRLLMSEQLANRPSWPLQTNTTMFQGTSAGNNPLLMSTTSSGVDVVPRTMVTPFNVDAFGGQRQYSDNAGRLQVSENSSISGSRMASGVGLLGSPQPAMGVASTPAALLSSIAPREAQAVDPLLSLFASSTPATLQQQKSHDAVKQFLDAYREENPGLLLPSRDPN